MKKSKIIVPALAVIAFSAAASVTGTVAWFTATRSATISTDSFALTQVDGNLGATAAGLVGTTATNAGTTHSIALADSGETLGDASFNPSTKVLWTDTGEGTEFKTVGANTSYSDTSNTNPWIVNAETYVYWAVSWKVTFSYEFSADHRPVQVFFDQDSTMTIADAGSNEGTEDSGTALRICMWESGGSSTLTWAKNQTEAKCTYVSGASSDAGTYGGANRLIASNTSAITKATDDISAATGAARLDYVAQINYNATPANCVKDVFFVAWFEGSDENVINSADLKKVASTMKFYCRTVEA